MCVLTNRSACRPTIENNKLIYNHNSETNGRHFETAVINLLKQILKHALVRLDFEQDIFIQDSRLVTG